MAGILDSATNRVATCEQTLQLHALQLQRVSDRQTTLTARWESFHQKWNTTIQNGLQQQEASHTTDFFLGGIPQFPNFFGLSAQTDPVEVVATMLRILSLFCSVDRIFGGDNSATSRHKARAVVLWMRSSFLQT
jgi:hypothetical protein